MVSRTRRTVSAGNRDTGAVSIVWLRQDLRLADNPALLAACARGGAVLPVYIESPGEEGEWPPGAASRWWLRRSLAALAAALEARGSRLILRAGPALAALCDLARESGARAICWSRRYEPAAARRDAALEAALRRDGIEARTFNSALLFEPDDVRTRAGAPFQVFTPFWNSYGARGEPASPAPAPGSLPPPARWPRSLTLADLDLERGVAARLDRVAAREAAWRPGEAGAEEALSRLLGEVLEDYPDGRDRPDRSGTSRLSPHLHHGEISPRAVWHAVTGAASASRRRTRGARRAMGRSASSALGRPSDRLPGRPSERAPAAAFLRQLVWREFAIHLLHHFPRTALRPLRPSFERFPWIEDPAALRRWQRGETGYPIVDAGMRELLETGWMHNRVRMIAASFLVKDLLISWTEGARWFWERLVDADLANNTLGWQWVAGCGADAAPYFRIFNPVLQGMKFDPRGEYVRRWIPELARLPDDWIHRPWQTPGPVRRLSGVAPDEDYPAPIVDHGAARLRALAALASAPGRSASRASPDRE